jgi:hypothetical protein
MRKQLPAEVARGKSLLTGGVKVRIALHGNYTCSYIVMALTGSYAQESREQAAVLRFVWDLSFLQSAQTDQAPTIHTQTHMKREELEDHIDLISRIWVGSYWFYCFELLLHIYCLTSRVYSRYEFEMWGSYQGLALHFNLLHAWYFGFATKSCMIRHKTRPERGRVESNFIVCIQD